MKEFTWMAFLATGCLLLCSCGDSGPPRKETYPVTGEVYVDGSPADQLAVRCVSAAGIDKTAPTFSSAFTNEEGKFEISTYEQSDGVPEGDYVLTFEWGKWNITGSYGGPDKLKNRYKDAKKSETKVTVKSGEPTDLGRIDLKTK